MRAACLQERNGNLLTIAQLSEQNDDARARLDDMRASEICPEAPRRPSVPRAPAFSETSLSAVPTPLQRSASVEGEGVDGNARPASSRRDREAALDEAAERDTRSYAGRDVGSTQSAVFTRTVGSAARHMRGNSMPALGASQSPATAAGAAQDSDSENEVTETRGALHADMQEVLDESRALKAALAARDAARDAELAENSRLKAAVAALPDVVDDELRVLETVVDVMELDLSGDRAREMQATITSIGMTPTAAAGGAAVDNALGDEPQGDEAQGDGYAPQGGDSLGDGYAPQGDESQGDGYSPGGGAAGAGVDAGELE